MDSSGNVFITGVTNGSFDGSDHRGLYDAYVTKLDKVGTQLWTRQFGIRGSKVMRLRIAISAIGNFSVLGATDGSFPGHSENAAHAYFLINFDSSGIQRWVRTIRADSFDSPDVVMDATGNSYLAGSTSLNLETEEPLSTRSAFLIKYDTNGSQQWMRQIYDPSGHTTGTAVALDATGNIFLCGETTAQLGKNHLASVIDAFVAKFSFSGTHQWTRLIGTGNNAFPPSADLAVDRHGNLFIVGSQDIGIFLIKIDDTMTIRWRRVVVDTELNSKNITVRADNSGNAILSGELLNRHHALIKSLVVKYDGVGSKMWEREAHDAGFWFGANATDALDNVFVSGNASISLDSNIQRGSTDFFVMKFDPLGTKK